MPKTLDIRTSLSVPRFEPVKRFQGGVFGFASHRFPIKGGVTLWDVMKAANKNRFIEYRNRAQTTP